MPKLPPGPKGKIWLTYNVLKNPYTYYPYLLKKYGDPVLLNALNGLVVATADPETIQSIFSADPVTYDPFAVETLVPLVGNNSLFVITGEKHQKERKLLMPSFHGERMRTYAETMQSVTYNHFRDLPIDKVFRAHDIATEISLEIIIQTVFGIKDVNRIAIFKNAVAASVKAGNPILIFSKALQKSFLGISPWDKFKKAQSLFHGLLEEEIQNKINAHSDADDILSMLIDVTYEDGTKMSMENLRDHALTLLFAGHETTAVAITWALYHLYHNPECLQNLKDELDKNENLDLVSQSRLPYLKGVCDETLRLNPIIPDFLRTLAKPLSLKEYKLETGVSLGIISGVTHYNPDIYEDPYKFKPERFMEKKYRPWEFMPFGGGHRRCIGAAFASFEMAIVLATILKNFKLDLCEPSKIKTVRRNVTMAPKSGIRMAKRK